MPERREFPYVYVVGVGVPGTFSALDIVQGEGNKFAWFVLIGAALLVPTTIRELRDWIRYRRPP